MVDERCVKICILQEYCITYKSLLDIGKGNGIVYARIDALVNFGNFMACLALVSFLCFGFSTN